jgi:predicted TIM-barrel fold metal-dependent hydrolase
VKIDVYCHILPARYQAILEKKVTGRDQRLNTSRYAQSVPTLVDLDLRFQIMDRFDGYAQVLSLASPAPYEIAGPETAVELCRIANDEIAELINRYPDRFVGGIAALPMNDMDAALTEAERAVKDLRLRGVEVYTAINGRPLDAPEFRPLFKMMTDYNLPVFIHPIREMTTPDYEEEEFSKYRVWTKLGWPYETALAMTRLVYGGVMEEYPGLKVVTHHCGGIIPFLAGRVTWSDDFNEMRMGHRDIFLKEKALEYYRRFYYDTAVNGHTAALLCGYSFCGVDQMVFATDMPFGNQLGVRLIRDTVESIERMGLDEKDKKKIYADNAIRMMRLPLGVL